RSSDGVLAGTFGFDSGSILVIQNLSGGGGMLELNPSGGNVGIGTTAPNSMLHVGNAATGGTFEINGKSGVSNNYKFDTMLGNRLAVLISGIEKLSINNLGNVGVGTTGPRAKLEIVASGSTTGTAFQIDDSLFNPKVTVLDNGNVGVGTTLSAAKFQVGAGTPNAFDTTKTTNAYIAGDLEVDGKIYGDGSMLTGVSGAVSGLTTYAVPRAGSSTTLVDSGIYTDANGSVGIGTTFPAYTLDVLTGSIKSGYLYVAATAYANNLLTYSANANLTIKTYTSGYNVLINPITGNVGIGTVSPASTLDVKGSFAVNIVSKSTDYTLTAADRVAMVDASAGAVTITLPDPSGIKGRVYDIKKTDASANALNINTAAGNIDGSASVSTTTPNASFTIVTDGTNWWVI
ncbi:MAG: hypothetical protein V2A70_08015, partial [Candidatus Omnitrophota bacterium]